MVLAVWTMAIAARMGNQDLVLASATFGQHFGAGAGATGLQVFERFELLNVKSGALLLQEGFEVVLNDGGESHYRTLPQPMV
jgi:hypothetical protein